MRDRATIKRGQKFSRNVFKLAIRDRKLPVGSGLLPSPETSPPPRHFPPIAPISSPCLNKFYPSPIVSIATIPFQFTYIYIFSERKEETT